MCLGLDLVSLSATFLSANYRISPSNVLPFFVDYHHREMVDNPSVQLDESVRARLAEAGATPTHEYIGALRDREPAMIEFDLALGECFAVLLPTTAVLAPPIADVDPASACSLFTRAANYLGLCALSLPTGLTDAVGGEPALPTSMQIIGRAREEALTLHIAAAYEATRGPLTAYPPLYHPPLETSTGA